MSVPRGPRAGLRRWYNCLDRSFPTCQQTHAAAVTVKERVFHSRKKAQTWTAGQAQACSHPGRTPRPSPGPRTARHFRRGLWAGTAMAGVHSRDRHRPQRQRSYRPKGVSSPYKYQNSKASNVSALTRSHRPDGCSHTNTGAPLAPPASPVLEQPKSAVQSPTWPVGGPFASRPARTGTATGTRSSGKRDPDGDTGEEPTRHIRAAGATLQTGPFPH